MAVMKAVSGRSDRLGSSFPRYTRFDRLRAGCHQRNFNQIEPGTDHPVEFVRILRIGAKRPVSVAAEVLVNFESAAEAISQFIDSARNVRECFGSRRVTLLQAREGLTQTANPIDRPCAIVLRQRAGELLLSLGQPVRKPAEPAPDNFLVAAPEQRSAHLEHIRR